MYRTRQLIRCQSVVFGCQFSGISVGIIFIRR